MIFAEVIIDISVKNLDKPFQYRVPENMEKSAVIGAPVIIPFGKGNREMKGFIIGLSDKPQFDINRTKSIIKIEEQGVIAESHLLSLAYWMKEQYGSTMNDAIKAVMPVRREIKEKRKRRIYPNVDSQKLTDCRNIFEQKHNVARVRLLDALLMNLSEYDNGIDYDYAIKALKITPSVINGLITKELICIEEKTWYRNPLEEHEIEEKKVILNKEQQYVTDSIINDLESGKINNYLIHGVTGSGKTEVYMHLAEYVISKGKQIIILVPEIALTFQNIKRFYGRFGKLVSMIHSRLSAGERYDQFCRAKQGDIKIMIGPRSALFTPFQNLGMIIIDEEHEGGYQSDTMPKYNAREVAIERGRMLGASVVMGSATPSLEAYYQCQKGEIQLLKMTQRAGNAMLPNVYIADLRQELAARNYSIFSRRLQQLMEERLKKKEQILLFLNRRGYAGFVSCRKCGEVIQCDHCSVAMKAHEYKRIGTILKCHYCGAERKMPAVCPKCGSKYIGTFGLGTQQVEDMVKKRFPTARILRMDADTTTGKEGHSQIIRKFSNQEADILVGTQMIVKGHDFANVTLVGILAADLSLNANEYRAAEHTYQLLAQAAGRAGRAEKRGDVVLQTYQPQHYSIVCAANQNYEEFYQKEMAVRQMLQYPPISNILGVLAFSENKEKIEKLLNEIKQKISRMKQIIILGPTDASIAKLKDNYRMILYIKSKDDGILRKIKDYIEKFILTEEYRDCYINFDFNT